MAEYRAPFTAFVLILFLAWLGSSASSGGHSDKSELPLYLFVCTSDFSRNRIHFRVRCSRSTTTSKRASHAGSTSL
jgi:hypothetical protein